jgi:hypothetical protein
MGNVRLFGPSRGPPPPSGPLGMLRYPPLIAPHSTARSKNKEQVKNALCYDDKTLVSRRSTDLLMIYFSLYSLRQRIILRYRIPLDRYRARSNLALSLYPLACLVHIRCPTYSKSKRGRKAVVDVNKPLIKKIQECASIVFKCS